MTYEEKQALASLLTLDGYHVLLKVVKSRRKDALDLLKRAKGRDERADAAAVLVTWDDAVELLETAPKQVLEELKTEGDPIYA